MTHDGQKEYFARRLIGTHFSLLDYVDVGERLKQGEWFVLLYHFDCSACQRFIENWAARAPVEGSLRKVALVEVPPFDSTDQRAL